MRLHALEHLHPIWFVPVMGLSGLTLAWWRAAPLLGPWADAVGQGLSVLVALVFALVLLASGLRAWQHPKAWRADAAHPVRHVFLAAISVSTILVATLAARLLGPLPLVKGLWMLGASAQAMLTLWVLSRWLRPGAQGAALWPGVTPGLLIPVVGNVLAPLGAVPLGLPLWGAAQLGLGVVLWPLVLALLWVRIGVAGLWPERMRPSVFVLIAPPAVTGVAILPLGAPLELSAVLWGVALFFTVLALLSLRRCLALPFGMPMWSLSFPLASFAALTLRLAEGADPLMQGLAVLALGFATVVIAALVLATLRGLWRADLLVPEPAPPAPVKP